MPFRWGHVGQRTMWVLIPGFLIWRSFSPLPTTTGKFNKMPWVALWLKTMRGFWGVDPICWPSDCNFYSIEWTECWEHDKFGWVSCQTQHVFWALSYPRSCLPLGFSMCCHCSATFLLLHPRAAGEVTTDLQFVCSTACHLILLQSSGERKTWLLQGLLSTLLHTQMGLSADLMPLANEVASHCHRPVLTCQDIPCAIGTALLALPTGSHLIVPIGGGVWKVEVCKEITNQECKGYSWERQEQSWKLCWSTFML